MNRCPTVTYCLRDSSSQPRGVTCSPARCISSLASRGKAVCRRCINHRMVPPLLFPVGWKGCSPRGVPEGALSLPGFFLPDEPDLTLAYRQHHLHRNHVEESGRATRVREGSRWGKMDKASKSLRQFPLWSQIFAQGQILLAAILED